MKPDITSADDSGRIRRLIDGWARAVRANDLDAIMSRYTPDILAFDAIGELQFRGTEAYRRHWRACLDMCPGPIFEIHDLSLELGDSLAFGHYLLRCGVVGEGGEEKAGWTRVTVGLRKRSGRWAIVHEHFSAPFDLATGRALLDLAPEHLERAHAA